MPTLRETPFHSVLKKPAMLVVILIVGVASVLCAQSTGAEKQSPIHHLTFSESAGGSLVTGNSSKMTTTGGSLIVGIGDRRNRRWAYSFDTLLSFNGVPQAVLRQERQPNGQEDLLAFALDPVLKLADGTRWGAYATGGAGLSFKRVVFLRPSSTCSDAYGCNSATASESSLQPAVDGGFGVTYRVHRDGKFQLFPEVRYLEMSTPKGQFPGFNTAGTSLVLLTFGFRL